jgi:hypothetical protein
MKIMTTNDTLRKAEIALGVILEYDEKNSNCTFKELLATIMDKWRDLK